MKLDEKITILKTVDTRFFVVLTAFITLVIFSNYLNSTETYSGRVLYNCILLLGPYLLYVLFSLITPETRLYKILIGLGGMSFFVYCSHVFFIHPYQDIVKSTVGISSGSYLLVFLLVTLSSIVIGLIIKKILPKIFGVLTGNRL